MTLGHGSLFSFCVHELGLSRNKAWNRTQAARASIFHPELIEMIRTGKTHVSHIALLAPKITKANCRLVMQEIKGKTKREVERFASKLTLDGDLLETPAKIELKINCSPRVIEKFDRAKDILSSRGNLVTSE